jgi:hypothetical protein
VRRDERPKWDTHALSDFTRWWPRGDREYTAIEDAFEGVGVEKVRPWTGGGLERGSSNTWSAFEVRSIAPVHVPAGGRRGARPRARVREGGDGTSRRDLVVLVVPAPSIVDLDKSPPSSGTEQTRLASESEFASSFPLRDPVPWLYSTTASARRTRSTRNSVSRSSSRGDPRAHDEYYGRSSGRPSRRWARIRLNPIPARGRSDGIWCRRDRGPNGRTFG